MKRVMIVFVLGLVMCSCSNKADIKEKVYDYDLIEERKVSWNNLFSIADNDYFGYIYSETCGHCKEVKPSMIEATLNGEINVYYIEYDQSIPIVDSYATNIGKGSVDEIGIIGTPTLFHIQNHIITEQFAGAKDILYKLSNV